jgi:hypothetical protein
VLAAYGPVPPGTGERVLFFARCAALEDLAFGEGTGRHEYGRAARRSLARLFPGPAGAGT